MAELHRLQRNRHVLLCWYTSYHVFLLGKSACSATGCVTLCNLRFVQWRGFEPEGQGRSGLAAYGAGLLAVPDVVM